VSDVRARLDYLDGVLSALFPPSHRHVPYTLLPHRLVPRRLVPRAGWHRLLGRAVRVPAGDDTIEGHLGEVLGRPVRVAVRVRPALRANRKPVLEAHCEGGLRAFVKIGDSARAGELVRHEAATLRTLADAPLRVVTPPAVLHHGRWRGMDVLVLGALPVRRARPSPALLTAAIREIGGLGDWAWHGDFSPWNIAPGPGGRLLVWDWERFATGVPPGFDALHHFFQRALRRARPGAGPAAAARACLARAAPTLEPFGVPARQARATALRYLLTLADRHADDGHEPLGPPARWLSPLIDHQEVVR
jgi:hypothetical protein